jgi:hypothetical protein
MKSGSWIARTNFVPGGTALNPKVLAFFLAFLAICGCSNHFDPRSASSREANAVRSLIHGQDSLDWIYDTLTLRGYTCTDQRDLNSTRMIGCGISIAWQGRCNYRVLVQRIEKRPEGEYDVQSIRPCLFGE